MARNDATSSSDVDIVTIQALHQIQDLQSLALHEEAVRLAKTDPNLVQQAQNTVQRWLATGDVRSSLLWREWADRCSVCVAHHQLAA